MLSNKKSKFLNVYFSCGSTKNMKFLEVKKCQNVIVQSIPGVFCPRTDYTPQVCSELAQNIPP